MRPALLLVDLQADYLATPRLQPRSDALIARAAALLEGCRRRRVPVIHLWTTVHRETDQRLPHWKERNHWQCVAGTDGHKPPAPLQPRGDEVVVHKQGFNGFANGELEAALKHTACDSLIIAGLHLHACVRTAAVECLERGLQVSIAEDSVASNDPLHAASTRRWLAQRCVRFEPAGAIFARLDNNEPTPLVHRSPRESRNILFSVPIADDREIGRATAAAKEACTTWRRAALPLRLQTLQILADRLDAAAPELARQMAIEIGKPISHGLEEVSRAARNVRDVIQRAGAFEFERREPAGMVRHQPLGVVALISPWNNPVAIPAGKIAPALAYGNVVVWKPAPAATRISQRILQLIRDAGVPAQAVQLLTGDHTTAQRLAADESTDAVTFTGALLGGHAMQEISARRIVPLQAELSGNNAAIVWEDADLKGAARQIVSGAFGFAGQRCTANRRAIVSAKCYEPFLDELKIAATKMVWGDPLEQVTEIGPVIHSAKRDDLTALVAGAQADGGAHRLEYPFASRAKESWIETGSYAQPVITCCDEPSHSLVQEETMSPLLVVQRATDFEHALALNNAVRHGLAAALFSHRAELHEKFLAQAHCGILRLNTSTAGADVRLPFGGWKASSVGPPEHGMADPLFYTRIQSVYGAT